jgi:hypothetical protein
MNNPYNILGRLEIGVEILGNILSYGRPEHKICRSIKREICRCVKCERVLRMKNGKVGLCYYKMEKGCNVCGIVGGLVCGDCIGLDCVCDSEEESMYSWFSF